MSNGDRKHMPQALAKGEPLKQKQEETWTDLEFFCKAVKEGIGEEFINKAEQFGEWLSEGKEKVSRSQIRAIYSSIKRLEMQTAGNVPDPATLEQLRMVRPQIAYAATRHSGKMTKFQEVVKRAIQAVTEAESDDDKKNFFRRFCKGMEAILAYHTQK